MKILINNEIAIDKWIEFLVVSPSVSVFQTPTFYNLFNSIPGLSAELFAIEETSEIKALCLVTLQKESGISGFFSRRAIIYGGPLVCSEGQIFLGCLLNYIYAELKNRVIYTEIRNLSDYNAFRKVFESNGWQYIPYQNFRVDCTDKELLFQKLGNNRKRQLRKALKSGVEIKEAENIKEISEYYNILKKLYRKKD